MLNSSNDQPKENNWIQELRRVREEAITQRIQEQAGGETGPARTGNQATSLLRAVNGLEYLRDIQKEVLNGQGILEQFENEDKYERAFALIWDGSISNPSRPKDAKVMVKID